MMFDAQDFVEVRRGVDDVVDALNQLRADVGVGAAAPRRCRSKGNKNKGENNRAFVSSDLGMNNAVVL